MSQKQKVDAVGFPPPLMGDTPLRLPVLAETSDWIALDKPANLLVREYPWDGNRPNLDAALNQQLQAEKPELVRRAATLFGSVYYLDPEISGVALFAKGRDSLSKLRNTFGSGDCGFRFIFVTEAKPEGLADTFVADAPLLPHNVKSKMIPSSAKGKKCFTNFRQIAVSPYGWTVWEAGVTFFRPHQVRAHAAVHGLPILGDSLYGGVEVPTQRNLQVRKRGGGLNRSAFEGLPLHLSSFQMEKDVFVQSPLPKAYQLFLKRLAVDVDFQ